METNDVPDNNATTDPRPPSGPGPYGPSPAGAPAPGPRVGPSSGTGFWLTLGIGLTVLAVAGAGLSAVAWLGRQSEDQHQVYRQPITRMVADLDTGDVVVRRSEDGTVDVLRHLVWSWTKPRIDESWDGQTLRTRVQCPAVSFGPGCEVDYEIRIPEGTVLDLRTDTGDIRVSDVRGDAQLRTDTGDIVLRNASGTVGLRTDTGDIRASDLAAAGITAATDTGDVDLLLVQAADRVAATTDTGDITITVPGADRYRVVSAVDTGEADISVVNDPNAVRTIEVRTDTGDIRVRGS